MKRIGLLLMSGCADEKPADLNISGEIFFQQDTSGGLCEIRWTAEGEKSSKTCTDCNFELNWIYDVLYSHLSENIPSACSGSRIADYSQNESSQTATFNNYSSIWAYTDSYPDVEGGVVLFGYMDSDEIALAPFANAEWNSVVSRLSWERMDPNQVITEGGFGVIY